jgi:hypothetical protein
MKCDSWKCAYFDTSMTNSDDEPPNAPSSDTAGCLFDDPPNAPSSDSEGVSVSPLLDCKEDSTRVRAKCMQLELLKIGNVNTTCADDCWSSCLSC